MKLLDQKMKAEMEECKRKAREAGLQFSDETLEYEVTNRDMLELRAKDFIPTLYDHWMQDVEVYRNKFVYEAFPHNPYETTINTRPPISFYNTGNPAWLNVMIFYHVLAHIDFLQNNIFFRRTWQDDFVAQALADKRLINKIRDELGPEKRWVDYVIEFALTLDNLVGFYPELEEFDRADALGIFKLPEKVDFYFHHFLKERYEAGVVKIDFYFEEVDRYNRCIEKYGKDKGCDMFFEDPEFLGRFPEFNAVFKKWEEKDRKPRSKDILEYLIENSDFLKKQENSWMKDVIQVIRRTSLYFQPQIRTKIANEGWATFWHEKLYVPDPRIKTHEVDWAVVNARVAFSPRIGINPYAIGKCLFEFIEDMAKKGRLSREYQLLKDIEERRQYDRKMGEDFAKQVLFELRRTVDDRLLINFLSDEDFQDFVDRYKLFVAGVRLSQNIMKQMTQGPTAEIYIKSKKGSDYRQLLNKILYHPPYIEIEERNNGELYLNHIYEGRSLVTEYIPTVLQSLYFFWKKPVSLETTEFKEVKPKVDSSREPEIRKVRVVYTYKDKGKIERKEI